jgi:hypothetical protein
VGYVMLCDMLCDTCYNMCHFWACSIIFAVLV